MQNLLIDRPSEEEKFEIMKKMYYSIPESSSGRYSLPDLRPMDEVYSDFLKRGDSLIVLRSGEEIVGHVHSGPQIDERLAFGRSGHIYDLFVSDIYRRRGAGKLLLSASLEELKRSSYLTVTANTYRLGAGWRLPKSDFYHCDIHDGKDSLSASATAIITSINPFMQIFSHIFFGKVMYRIGPRKSTLIGIGLTIFTMLFFAMAQSWVLIALGYFSLGIAFGAFINGAGTMISLSSPPERRAEFLGLLRSARAIGFMVEPLLAGTVAEYSYFVMFIMMASLIAAGGLIVIVFTKDRLITS